MFCHAPKDNVVVVVDMEVVCLKDQLLASIQNSDLDCFSTPVKSCYCWRNFLVFLGCSHIKLLLVSYSDKNNDHLDDLLHKSHISWVVDWERIAQLATAW